MLEQEGKHAFTQRESFKCFQAVLQTKEGRERGNGK
jgi:hypothetical protein